MNKEILKKKLIDLQKKDCCKFWIAMWIDKIYKVLKHVVGGGIFNHCPECGKKFRKLK